MSESCDILVVDDEKAIADLVVELLEREGLSAQASYSGAQAFDLFQKNDYSLLIVDIMMPGMNGFELCQKVRSSSEVPLIFLSAKDEEVDKVVGLTIGADDYVTKPFKPRELVARVKARLRRREIKEFHTTAQVLSGKGIILDVAAHTATLHDELLQLTPKEYDILALLLKAQGKPVAAQEIFETVWKEPFDSTANNTIMVHIRNLRKKLADIDTSEIFIETAWGVGYRISSPKKESIA